ncbi:MAG: SDR family oxidoreductase [Caulobacteraceae bacterium]
MQLTGNTIFITGGGSGIGRGLAEAFNMLGNKVIIGGRRRGHLDSVVAASPGIEAIELDVTDRRSIDRVAGWLRAKHPELNVLINNAGIMELDQAGGRMNDARMVATIATNLMGPIRVTSALIEHLKTRDRAAVAYVSSGLAFTPLAPTAVYSSTKAALHSYALSQRFMLGDTSVEVFEIAPPWVRTDLMNSRDAEEAMPVDQFVDEVMAELGAGVDEVIVEAARPLRVNAGPHERNFMNQYNIHMMSLFARSTERAAA